MRSQKRATLRYLILLHRYLGVPLGVLFVIWFASGMVMMYAREMPRMTPTLRLERLASIDFSRIQLTPSEAARKFPAPPAGASLEMVLGRPVYRFDRGVVFADDGTLLQELSSSETAIIASDFMGEPLSSMQYLGTLSTPDQWTLLERDRLPLHQFQVDDDIRSRLYISPQTGKAVVYTTRWSRFLAWIGAIPHWFYFAMIRSHTSFWRQLIIWSTSLGCIIVLSGLTLALTQLRWSHPRKKIPYRGLMRWHYLLGAFFGVTTLTWTLSGLLSIEPFTWGASGELRLPAHTLSGGALQWESFPPMDAEVWEGLLAGGLRPKQIEFVQVQKKPYYGAWTRGEGPPLMVAADTAQVRREPFSKEFLLAQVAEAMPHVPLPAAEVLSHYDSYYYSRDHRLPLPVLRLKFSDREQTWAYIDPHQGRVLAVRNRRQRVMRWVYHGLHSLDFPFWYYRRPLWDVALIILLLGGLATSGLGLCLGLRRVRDWLRNMA